MANNYERKINPSQTTVKKKKKRKRGSFRKKQDAYLILSIIQNIRETLATKKTTPFQSS